jgi:hypothetical protein
MMAPPLTARSCLGIALFGLLLAAPAAGQPEKPPEKTEPAAPPSQAAEEKPATGKPAAAQSLSGVSVERTASGQKLFRITEGLVVEGQRQKPNAFYVLQRASTPYDWEALDESFLVRIIKAAEKPPF